MDFTKVKKKTVYFLYDHPVLYSTLKNSYMVIITALSALIFSFGFKCFISPNYSVFWDFSTQGDVTIRTLASTGASGMSQVFEEILKLCGVEWITESDNQYIVNFVFYLAVNIPLCIFAFFKIGKKFAIYTALNCIFTTVLGIVIPTSSATDFVNQVASAVFDDPVSRILFAGICTGLSTALAYSINTSTGGVDVAAFYISEKKSTPAGRYSAIQNAVIVIIYSILSVIPGGVVGEAGSGSAIEAVTVSTALVIVLYTILYMIIVTLVVDTMDTRNRKVELQIVTKNPELSQIIIANVPHGCTVINGEGGFSGEKVYIINMSVRKNESKKITSICRRADPNCFINVLSTEQIYGRFSREMVE